MCRYTEALFGVTDSIWGRWTSVISSTSDCFSGDTVNSSLKERLASASPCLPAISRKSLVGRMPVRDPQGVATGYSSCMT